MSRNKKLNSIMDITQERQKSIMDELYRLEKGLPASSTTSIFEVSGKKSKKNKKKKKYGMTGLSMDLENAIAKKAMESNPEFYQKEEERTESFDYEVDDYPSIFPEPYAEEVEGRTNDIFNPVISNSPMPIKEDEEEEEKENRTKIIEDTLDQYINDLPDSIKNVIAHPDWFPTSKGIEFGADTVLNRIVINDGVSPTTMSIKYMGLGDEIDLDGFDPDDMIHMIHQIYAFIISSKHPTAIFTNEEFVERFEKIGSVNGNEFIFFGVDNYVLMYYVNEEERNVLSEITEIYNMSDRQVLQFYITLFYRCNETHNIFFIEDNDYIELYRREKASKLSDYYMFLVESSPDTTFLEVGSREKIFERLNVLAAKPLHTDVRRLVIKLSGDPLGMYDEDDEDENIDETEGIDEEDMVEEEEELEDEGIIEDEDDINAMLDYDPVVTIGAPVVEEKETTTVVEKVTSTVTSSNMNQTQPKTPKMTSYEQKAEISSAYGSMTIPVMKKQNR